MPTHPHSLCHKLWALVNAHHLSPSLVDELARQACAQAHTYGWAQEHSTKHSTQRSHDPGHYSGCMIKPAASILRLHQQPCAHRMMTRPPTPCCRGGSRPVLLACSGLWSQSLAHGQAAATQKRDNRQQTCTAADANDSRGGGGCEGCVLCVL